MLSTATVLLNEVSGVPEEGLRRLVLSGVPEGRPGQFLHIQVSPHLEPLLRRPLSIAAIDRKRKQVILFYRVQGRGTQLLAAVPPGAKLSVLGPLGRGFSLPASGQAMPELAASESGVSSSQLEPARAQAELWLVAGGIGVFPLLSLAYAAVSQRVPVRLFWGGQSKRFFESAGLSYWQTLKVPLHLTTLDGSLGRQAMVTEELEAELERRAPLVKISQAAACGPKGMMQAVAARILPLGIPLEVSLEERMGCGVGACLGCVVTVRGENGGLQHKKACQDGPVFRGEEVVWDEGEDQRRGN